MLRAIVICLLAVLPISIVTAHDKEFTVIKDLKWEWTQFDTESQQFVPYLKGQEVSSLTLALPLAKYKDFSLLVDMPKGYSLWIDQQLILTYAITGQRYYAIDSLLLQYSKSTLNVTIFDEELNPDLISIQVVNLSTGDEQAGILEGLSLRKDRGRMNVFIIGSIFVMIILVIFRSLNYRLFKEYFAFSKVIRVRQQFELLQTMSLVSGINMVVVLLYAVVVGVTILNFTLFSSQSSVFFTISLNESEMISLGVKFGLLALFLILLKIPFLSVMARLFQLYKVKNFHFFTYFRQSLIIVMILFIISILNGMMGGNLLENDVFYLQVLTATLLIVRVGFLFFALNRIHGYRKLHLFAYLCSTELIPLILISKIFLK